ncbi:MAG: hypothetical protein K6A65_07015, partial [Succinivibrionaceae bacterium]|nr:hypothetical protein [Succinivibrionaceae bacterium]
GRALYAGLTLELCPGVPLAQVGRVMGKSAAAARAAAARLGGLLEADPGLRERCQAIRKALGQE